MNETDRPKDSQHHRLLPPLGATAFVDTVLTAVSSKERKKESRQVIDLAAFLVYAATFLLPLPRRFHERIFKAELGTAKSP